MIGLLLLLAIFICISSIFFPSLRKLAMALITTAVVVVGGMALIFEIFSK